MRPESHEYFLIPTSVDLALETHHLQHADIAAQLGISRSYWSQLVNGRKLSPKVRRALREHPVLSGLAEDALWAKRIRVRSQGEPGVRLSAHLYVSPADVDRVLEVVAGMKG